MPIDQISVFVENNTGRLAEITEILGNAQIDLRALSIADTADFGILRLIVDDPQKTADILKEAGCVFSVTPVLAVSIEDTPGSLARRLRLLSDSGFSVEYAYAFITRKQNNAYVIFRVDDNDLAAAVLEQHGVKVAETADLFDL
ncbi:MAG: acetolactate synthase [Peptococcaceae bacterium]|jgi:hypothetical protein|nr:acetolactate synthase [Peptococcaceae bacterium]